MTALAITGDHVDRAMFTARGAGAGGYWNGWASGAPEKDCEACGRSYQPSHPRCRYCNRDDCSRPPSPSRRRTSPPRPRRAARPEAIAARAAAVQGFIGDVVIAIQRVDLPEPEDLAAAMRTHLRAVTSGDPVAARSSAVGLTALVTAHELARAAA